MQQERSESAHKQRTALYIRAINNNLLYPSDKTCFGKAIVPLKREFSVFRSLSAGLWAVSADLFLPRPSRQWRK